MTDAVPDHWRAGYFTRKPRAAVFFRAVMCSSPLCGFSRRWDIAFCCARCAAGCAIHGENCISRGFGVFDGDAWKRDGGKTVVDVGVLQQWKRDGSKTVVDFGVLQQRVRKAAKPQTNPKPASIRNALSKKLQLLRRLNRRARVLTK